MSDLSRRGVLNYLVRHFFSFRGFAVQATVLMLLMAVVNLPLPMLNKVAIDYVIPTGDPLPLVWLGLLAFVVRASASGFQVFQNFVVRRVMSGVGDRLRNDMIRSMLDAPYNRFVTGEIGSYTGRLSGDVTRTEMLINDTIRFIIRPAAMLILMGGVMAMISIPATLLLFTVTPISIFISRKMRHRLSVLEEEMLEKRETLQDRVGEVLDNIRVIRCYTREHTYERRIGETITEYTESSVEHATKQKLMQSLVDFIILIPWLIIVVAGGILIRSGDMSLGDFMAFITFEQLMHSPLAQLSFYALRVKAGAVAAERVREVTDVPSEPRGPIDLKVTRGEIELDRVRFGYGDSLVLKDLSVRIRAGERVAVVGPSGAGKTTLVSLLLRFYEPQSGDIRFDGQSILEANPADVRRSIGVVFQDNPIFDATIRENLVLIDDAISDEQIWDALRRADAETFVKTLPHGLDTLVGVKGLKLSGGQRQRLSIARVILKNPKIVLMDEATSSLDSVSENQIQKAMDELLAGCTSLTIAHRLSTVVKSDRILYMEDGQIIESGSHAELIKKEGAYYHLYRMQMDGLLEL